MNLKQYLKGKNREKLANQVGTSKAYIDQLCVGMRRASPEMALRIEIASGGAVTRMELLYPDSQDSDQDDGGTCQQDKAKDLGQSKEARPA